MSQEVGKDWFNYPLYTDPYIRRLHTEVDFVLKRLQKTTYKCEDFSHFDCMHYCEHQWLKRFLDANFLGKEMKVMELCSGAGSSARYIASNYKATVTALDFTDGLNQVHRRINALCGIENISVMQGDATNFDHTALAVDGNCDLVYSILSILHIENRAGVYKSANRALKIGGKFYIEDFTRVSPLAESEDDIEACRIMRFCSRPTTSQNCQLLEEAGFQVEEYTQRTRAWSEYVYDRAEHALAHKAQIIREHGEDLFSTTYYLAIWSVTKLYHDLGLSLEEVKQKYPLLTMEVGEDFLRKWTQDAIQMYGGSVCDRHEGEERRIGDNSWAGIDSAREGLMVRVHVVDNQGNR